MRPFSDFSTWLFDLDGTLIDSNSAVVDCVKKTVEEVGGKVTDETALRASFGKGLMNTLAPWIPEGSLDRALAGYFKNFPEIVQKNLKLFDGVMELLELLKSRSIPMGVITGNVKFEADGIFERLQFGHYFQTVMCADSIPFQKPSPEPVREALRRMKRPVGGAVFIGDSEHDISSGRLAGVATIGILGGSSKEERLRASKPDFIVQSIREVLQLLGG